MDLAWIFFSLRISAEEKSRPVGGGALAFSDRDGEADGDSETQEAGSSQGPGAGPRDGRGDERDVGMEGVARRVLGPLPPGAGRHDRAIVALLRQGARIPGAAEALRRGTGSRARCLV